MTDRLSFPMPATASPFRTPLAVDTWDAHFRWREGGRLRDLTIDATWQRVARALAGGHLSLERELLDAFAGWYLLPDARLIATAGTHAPHTPDKPTASINLHAFIKTPHAAGAWFDRARLAATATLAVRALEQAAPQSRSLQIGVVGFGDALQAMHIEYGSSAACALARDVAQTIWCNAVEASSDNPRNADACLFPDNEWIARARTRGLAEAVLQRIRACGMWHARVAAITSQPALSRFANCVSDALDPVGLRCETPSCASDGRPRSEPACQRRTKIAGTPDSVVAQLRTRAAMQPWMDEPISYPVATRETFDDTSHRQWRELARHHDLGELTIEKAC